ncbi:MAG: J domain-containing protein, partial [Thermoflexaceae bacterium]|nr:J domain-containing protein [Thermoflexaceae bacterium]
LAVTISFKEKIVIHLIFEKDCFSMGKFVMNYYAVLQVDEKASQEEIKQAYHKMARLFHPDNFNGSQNAAAEQMEKINEAYAVLSDIQKRQAYDMLLNNSREEPVTTDSRMESVKKGNVDEPVLDRKKNKESSCLTKIFEWIICIAVGCFVFNYFHIGEKVKSFIGSSTPIEQGKTDSVSTKKQMDPDELVETYLEYIRRGDDISANSFFTVSADDNFQTCTVSEYNQTVTGMYYGFEDDIPTYPLFEEIRNFEYSINGVELSQDGNSAKVYLDIQNCDVALIFGLILQADEGENILENMDDSELQKLLRIAISKYKTTCLISTNATFTVKKMQDGVWGIDSISPLKDFSTVLTGQAADLIMSLNGEINVDGEDEYVDDEVDYEDDLLN